jgi:hypothetical protein
MAIDIKSDKRPTRLKNHFQQQLETALVIPPNDDGDAETDEWESDSGSISSSGSDTDIWPFDSGLGSQTEEEEDNI